MVQSDQGRLHQIPLFRTSSLATLVYFILLFYIANATNTYPWQFQRRCAKVADEAQAQYYDETPENERTCHGVWTAMADATAAEIKRIRQKDFDKMLAVANIELGKAFEQEVCYSIPNFWCPPHSYFCSSLKIYIMFIIIQCRSTSTTASTRTQQ